VAGVDDHAAIGAFLFSRLSADGPVGALLGVGAACRLFPEVAPQDEQGNVLAGYPYAVWSFNASRSRMVSGGRQRALSDQYVVIQATAEGTGFGAASSILQAIDASLTATGAEAVVAVGGVNHYVSVAGPGQDIPRRPELVKGKSYRTVGRIYRVQVFDR
jgi:hypothetical protein